MHPIIFKQSPSTQKLQSDEVHIWSVPAHQEFSKIEMFSQTLSDQESRRVNRFHFKRDRIKFIIRRGILRTILGLYFGIEPSSVQFCFGKYGKLFLLRLCGESSTIYFNLSYSKDLIFYAFTKGLEIGIDIEYIRYIPEIEEISRQILSESENQIFQTLSKNKKIEAFFRIWTRKEAFVKATGEGLYRALNTIELTQYIKCGIPCSDSVFENVRGWYFHELQPAPGYVAVFVVNRLLSQLHCYKWNA